MVASRMLLLALLTALVLSPVSAASAGVKDKKKKSSTKSKSSSSSKNSPSKSSGTKKTPPKSPAKKAPPKVPPLGGKPGGLGLNLSKVNKDKIDYVVIKELYGGKAKLDSAKKEIRAIKFELTRRLGPRAKSTKEYKSLTFSEFLVAQYAANDKNLSYKLNDPKKHGLATLGAGKVATAYTLRDKTGKTKVFKLEGTTLAGSTQAIPAAEAGLLVFGARTSNRAVAASKVDELLQTHVIVETHLHSLMDGKQPVVGQLMEKFGDVDLAALNEGQTKLSAKKQKVYDADWQKLVLIDYLIYQRDRHPENVRVDTKTGHLKGIDNDFTFGTTPAPTTVKVGKGDSWRGLPGSLKAKLDKTTRGRLLALTSTQLRKKLTLLLSKAEIEAACKRLENAKKILK